MELLEWVGGLEPSAASFVGSVTGASLGLFALVLGALLNAQLNRNRDERLRRIDRRALAIALQSELVMLRGSLLENANSVDEGTDDDLMEVPDPSQLCRVWPAVVDRVGLLKGATIQAVVRGYGVLPHFVDLLLAGEGRMNPPRAPNDTRVLITLPGSRRHYYSAAARGVADALSNAITHLDEELRR